jgi:hypothetical protein
VGRTGGQARNAQLVAERQAVSLGDGGRNHQWHTGTGGRGLVVCAPLAVERPDQQLDLTGAAEEEEPVRTARHVNRRQAGHHTYDRFGVGHVGAQPVDGRERQSSADVRGDFDDARIGGVRKRRTERVERTRQFGLENEDTEDDRHPDRHPDDAEQRAAPVRDQRGEVNAPERHERGPRPSHHGSSTASARRARPSATRSSRVP